MTRWQVMLWCCVLLLATLAAYVPAMRGGFIWDDDAYITDNSTLRTADGLRRIWFELRALPQYYPMVHTAFWIEYHLWGLSPFGYHVVNVLLHSLNAILLWQAMRELRVPGGGLAAALFALHPVHVESVAWITERKNVLSTLFYLLALLAYFRFRPLNKDDPGSWKYYAFSFVLFLCALLSKTVTCSLPAAILLLLWWKRNRIGGRDLGPLLPMFALGLAFGLLTARLEKHHVGAEGVAWALSFFERCLVAGRALWFYSGKLVWPEDLSFIYPRWQIDLRIWWQVLFPMGALAAVIVLWLMRKRVGKGPLVALLFFGGTLFPALGFFDVYPMLYSFVADHFQYLASMGLIVLFAGAYSSILMRFDLLNGWMDRVATATILLVLGTLVWRQGYVYRDLEMLWRDTLNKNPAAWMAHLNLGIVLSQQGKLDQAIAQYNETLRLHPGNPDAHYDLGNALVKQGKVEEAIGHYAEALRIRPAFYEAQNNMALALVTQRMPGEAVPFFREALRLNPVNAETHHHLALALASLGKAEEAIHHYREALRLKPDWPPAINDLAWILATHEQAKLRNGSQAVQLAERACALSQFKEPNYLDTLGAAYAEVGRYTDAAKVTRKAIELAQATGQTGSMGDYERHLRCYLANKPFRESLSSIAPDPR